MITVSVVVCHKSFFWWLQMHCLLHLYLKNKKVGLCGSIHAVSPPWREADVIKLFHLAACFCSTDTVERLAHPVELLLQPTVHSRCGWGSRMWQNNPGITVTGVCFFFFLSHWHRKTVYVRSWKMTQSQNRAQLNRIKGNDPPPWCDDHDGILKWIQFVHHKEKIWHEEAKWEFGHIKVGICMWD